MSDTPNEIWCGASLYWDYKKDWSEGSWLNNDNCGGVKYIRADRIKELEADLSKTMLALEKVQAFVRDLEPYADQGHTLVPALREACETLAELKGKADE